MQWFKCDRFGHMAQDFPNRINAQWPRNNNNGNNNNNNRRRRRDAAAHASFEESHCPQKKTRNTRYANNVGNSQFEYVLAATLSSSSLDTIDHWLVDSRASRYFVGYREILSNLVGRESNLKTFLGDNSTHHVIGTSSVCAKLKEEFCFHPCHGRYGI